jgi:enoyl-CoA hydratase
MSGEGDVLFERRGAIGLITLNRPKALNALTHQMCVLVKSQLDLWKTDPNVVTVAICGRGDRAFCAGGDIRSLYESGKAGTPYALDFYRDEYILNATIKHYPKPYVAMIHGIVMGGGVGVSVHGSHRIADETTVFAMPETGIGLFPDVGGSYFLPRCPGELGLYLALTGARLSTADAGYVGVATHFVPKANHEAIVEALASGRGVDDVLADLAADPGAASLKELRGKVDPYFSAARVEDVLEHLDRDGSSWALETARVIRTKSPTATKLAFRQIREGARLAFDDCMRMEFRMVNRVVAGHDFYEGVRATIIDKDQKPSWRPASLAEVTDGEIDACFAPLGEKELRI